MADFDVNPFSEEAREIRSSSPRPKTPTPKSPLTQVDELLQKIDDESLRKLFKDDIVEIQQCVSALKALQLLQNEMSSEESLSLGCFDEEDWKCVSEKRKSLETELSVRQNRVLKSIQEYDEKILRIMKTLDTRTSIIDTVQEKSGLFTNPLTQDIADFFASKHEKLEKVAELVKENMRQIMSASVRKNQQQQPQQQQTSMTSNKMPNFHKKSLVQSFQDLFHPPGTTEPKKPKKPRNYKDDDDDEF